jgi:hypothetical protein
MARSLVSGETFSTKCFVVAGILFTFELTLGIGLIGIGGGFLAATISFLAGHCLREKLRTAAIFVCVILGTFGWLVVNARMARRNAIPVITACKQFQSEQGRYPSNLTQLTPIPLASIPRARYTLAAKQFLYDSNRPALCYAAMFHGVFCHDFRSDQWVAND